MAMRSLCTAVKRSPCSRQLEKACSQQQRPSIAKNKFMYLKKITASACIFVSKMMQLHVHYFSVSVKAELILLHKGKAVVGVSEV